MRGVALAVIALVVLAGCAGGKAWEKVDLTKLPTPESLPDSKHVVLLDETTVRIFPDPSSGKAVEEFTDHVRWKILRPDDSVQVRAFYRRAWSRVTSMRARVILPDGTERTYEMKDALDKMAFSWEMFTDYRLLEIDLEQPPVGSVVEWEHTTHQDDARFFPAVEETQEGVPVQEMRFTVEYPEGWEVAVAHLNGDTTPDAPAVAANGMVKRSWSWHDLPLIKDEYDASEWEPPLLAVRLMNFTENGVPMTGFAKAEDLSNWSADLYGKTPELDPEMKKIFEKVLAGAPNDPTEKTRRLYDWVKDEIQYCAVEVGWGGWKPIAPSDVARVRYGDCKGKAELLHTFLTAAGISSRPVLIHNHSRQPIPFHIEIVNHNFNHVIDVVDLPGRRLVMDPTSHVPFGELPESDQGADLLPIAPGGEPVMKAPVAGPDENREEHQLDLELLPSGELKGKLELKAWNGRASMLEGGFRYEPPKKLHRVLEHWADLDQDTLGEPTYHARTSEEEAFTAEAKVHVQDAVPTAGATRALRIGARLLGSWMPTLPPGERQRPVWLGPPRSRHELLTMRLPKDLSALHLPDTLEAHCKWADYRMAFHVENGAVVMERQAKIVSSEVEPSDYPELIAFLDKVHAAESQAILLRPNP